MPVTEVSATKAPALLGGAKSNDPSKKTSTSTAETAVNDGLMIIGGAFAALVLLIFSVRKHIV